MDGSERPERPGPDADATEIARWMEEDFGRAVAEGMANAVSERNSDDEVEVMEVEILNHERGEVVKGIDGRESQYGERGAQNRLAGVSGRGCSRARPHDL